MGETLTQVVPLSHKGQALWKYARNVPAFGGLVRRGVHLGLWAAPGLV